MASINNYSTTEALTPNNYNTHQTTNQPQLRPTFEDDQDYPTSILCCQPLFLLRLTGFCCPLLETPPEQSARVAAYTLQSYPIIWYRKKLFKEAAEDVKGVVKEKGSAKSTIMTKGVNGFIDGLVTNVDKLLKTYNMGDEEHGIPMVYVGVSATLSVVDTAEYGPAIKVVSTEVLEERSTSGASTLGNNVDGALSDKSIKYAQKIIPLSQIDSVSAGWSILNDPTAGGIRLMSVPPEGGGFFQNVTGGQEILRFDTLGGGGNVFQPHKVGVKPNEYVDEVLGYLRDLVEWNRWRIQRKKERKVKRAGKDGRKIGGRDDSDGYISMS